ncbi:uncharacterized protein LOC128132484 [Lactuca sativa]|uniref:uncharacterized protein LOC128132484 n=1 Tax=Lactuca sativa TaxID=4236 RepID=UPI0022B07DBA|nr:uncharacterized protein LOC128132484 [Lactuca sativa]
MCPMLQEDVEPVQAMGFSSQQQGNFQPSSNPNWHQPNTNFQPRPPPYQPRPPFQNQMHHQQNYQPHFQPTQPPHQSQYQPQNMHQGSSSSGSGMSLEDIVKSLATSTQTFQNETKASIKTLEQQMTQLATSVSKLESQGKLPAQTEKNTKHSACVITLRNGKEYEGPKMVEEEEKMELEKEEEKSKTPSKQVPIEAKVTPPRFPSRLNKSKRESEDNEIMEMFRKVEVNIPLIDAIKQVPRYAKFHKELCTSKKKLKGNETVKVGENVSAVLQKRLPQKCKDPGVFTVPCKLGNLHVPRAMLDLGASINVLPFSIFKTLNIGTLKKTGVIIQLADRFLVHPKGVLEDLLVQVNELVFPADFYVLDMDDDDSPNLSSILLGRPFLKTARTKIDVYDGTLSMEFDGEVINFNIYDAMRYPSDISSLNFVDVIEPLTEECFDLSNLDVLALILNRNLQKERVEKLANQFTIDKEIMEVVSCMDEKKKMRFDVPKLKIPMSNEKLVPSIVQAPELELKTLPEHLKYAYLGDKETFPVIISTKLSTKEEEELVTTLKEYKEAIGWTIADIKGLSPSLCMHKILMEEDYKPSREAQRRLNPLMMEVVKGDFEVVECGNDLPYIR